MHLVLFDMMAFYRFPLEVEGGAKPSSSAQVHDQISQSLLQVTSRLLLGKASKKCLFKVFKDLKAFDEVQVGTLRTLWP